MHSLVARGSGGWGWLRRSREGGDHGWDPLMWQGQWIKAPPPRHGFQLTQTTYSICNKKNKHAKVRVVSGDRKAEPFFSGVQRAGRRAFRLPRSSLPAPGFIDWRLNGWCRCRAETTALLCWCNILLSNKHQPGCQHKQLILFRAVSFKGDEPEWLGVVQSGLGARGRGGGVMNVVQGYLREQSSWWAEWICFILLILSKINIVTLYP